MLDVELERLVVVSRQNGFARGLNFAADIVRKAGHADLALAIERQIFESDVQTLKEWTNGRREA